MLEDSNSLPSNSTENQHRKCLTEKKRREQENIYIKELAELLCEGFGGEESLINRTDKSTILQKTVERISNVLGASVRLDNNFQVINAPLTKSIISPDTLGPILLDALDGFLFIVNSNAQLEYVSKKVSDFLNYSQAELIGKPVYNIIHNGDHVKFHSTLQSKPPDTVSSSQDQKDLTSFVNLISSDFNLSTTPGSSSTRSSIFFEQKTGDFNNYLSPTCSSVLKSSSQFYVRFIYNPDSDSQDEKLRNETEASLTSCGERSSIISSSISFDYENSSSVSLADSAIGIPQSSPKAAQSSDSYPQASILFPSTPSSRLTNYVTMQLFTVHCMASSVESRLLTDQTNGSLAELGEDDHVLVCVARQKPASDYNPIKINVEQFSTKMDFTGKITFLDTSGLSSKYSQYLKKGLVGKSLLQLCHPNDVQKIKDHLKETIENGNKAAAISPIYKFVLSEDQCVLVQSKSKVFERKTRGYIASQNSIVRNYASED